MPTPTTQRYPLRHTPLNSRLMNVTVTTALGVH
jgi:hypothetical protein